MARGSLHHLNVILKAIMSLILNFLILIYLNSKTYVAFHGHSTSQALNSTTAAPGGTDIGTVSGAAATALQVLRTMFVNVGMDRYIGFNMNQWIVPIRGQICVSNKYIYIHILYTYISVELLMYLHLYICSLQR